MSGLLSNGTLQTIAIIAGPLLLPRVIGTARRFLRPNASVGLQPIRRADSARLALVRLGLVTLGVCFSLLMGVNPARNLFLPPAQSRAQQLLPLLRPPLSLRLPSDTLAQLCQHDLRRPLTDNESLILGACTSSLDARKLYLAFGAAPLVECTWCRTDDFAGRGDLLAYVLSPIAGNYLLVAALGAGLLSGERVRWRRWFVGAMVIGFAGEGWWRFSWAGPGNSPVLVLHTTLHVLRHFYFAVLLFLSYFVRPRLIPQYPSTASLLQPPLLLIGTQAESLLNRLRAASLQRMAILHHGSLRQKVTEFWANAEQESEWARADGEVQAAVAKRREGEEAAEFRRWIDAALAGAGGAPTPPPVA